MDVAVVDYEDPAARETFTRSLRETGFAVLVNHPLAWSLVERIYAEWAELFDSPAVERYLMDPTGQVGWFPPDRSETAKGNSVRDLKEFFHVYDWSVYPSEVSDAARQYREIATSVALTLLDWVEANTPADIAARFSMPLSRMMRGSRRTLLRVLRYPPLTGAEPDGAVRAAAHEDINLLTVLPASDEPGLELLRADGTWYPVLLPRHDAPGGEPDRRRRAAASDVAAAVPASGRRRRARRRPHCVRVPATANRRTPQPGLTRSSTSRVRRAAGPESAPDSAG